VDSLVFRSDHVAVGAFRCPPWHPLFPDSGPAQNHIFVFPRRAVRLCHEAGRPFVADPGLVTFYNRGQRYRRTAVDGPDECEWFAVAPALAADAVRQFDPAVDDRPQRPFAFEHGPGDARLYLGQRALYASLVRGRLRDPLEVEETIAALLDGVLARVYRGRGAAARLAPPTPRQRDVAEHARTLLARRLHDPLGLSFFARETGTSVFHLCKLFRAVTGSTLHGYRNRLRLQASLEGVAAGAPLTEVALDCGFSSHSHFTASFRRLFGATPSAVRRRL